MSFRGANKATSDLEGGGVPEDVRGRGAREA